jgi:hypothetical protein
VEDISLHILDIAENSVRADAKTIEIIIVHDTARDLLSIEVNDDGRGMDAGTLAKVEDPFFTTKRKKTGLGIPLLSQAAQQAGGMVTVESSPGKGTKVSGTFRWSHADRPAIGSMADTILTLIAGHPDLDVLYEARDGDRTFRLDTGEIRNDLEGVPINTPAVLDAIRGMLKEQIKFER